MGSSKQRFGLLPFRSISFIEPMECLVVAKLLDGPQWLYELKLDVYRAYVARVSNGFVPASRRQVFGKLKNLEVPDCPFVSLPEKH
jgi:ATP-dependent DNA ligase